MNLHCIRLWTLNLRQLKFISLPLQYICLCTEGTVLCFSLDQGGGGWGEFPTYITALVSALHYCPVQSLEVHPKVLLTHFSSPVQVPHHYPSLCFFQECFKYPTALDIIWEATSRVPLRNFQLFMLHLGPWIPHVYLGSHLLRCLYSHC